MGRRKDTDQLLLVAKLLSQKEEFYWKSRHGCFNNQVQINKSKLNFPL
jgi:hypothetical protein